jgi:hypothetical protein
MIGLLRVQINKLLAKKPDDISKNLLYNQTDLKLPRFCIEDLCVAFIVIGLNYSICKCHFRMSTVNCYVTALYLLSKRLTRYHMYE